MCIRDREYFQVEGFAYRFVPISGVDNPERLAFGTVATDIMYDNMMNKFKYGNMNDPKVYIDENNSRMMTNIRNSFNRLATGLIEEGKKDSAIAVIDRCFELIPGSIVPYEYFTLEPVSYTHLCRSSNGFAHIFFKCFNNCQSANTNPCLLYTSRCV